MTRGCGHLQRVPESEREGRTSSCLKHKQVVENDLGSGVGEASQCRCQAETENVQKTHPTLIFSKGDDLPGLSCEATCLLFLPVIQGVISSVTLIRS